MLAAHLGSDDAQTTSAHGCDGPDVHHALSASLRFRLSSRSGLQPLTVSHSLTQRVWHSWAGTRIRVNGVAPKTTPRTRDRRFLEGSLRFRWTQAFGRGQGRRREVPIPLQARSRTLHLASYLSDGPLWGLSGRLM